MSTVNEDALPTGAAIVELMGHNKISGHIRKVELGLIRIDAIEPRTKQPITKFYNPSAIYSITMITEESLAMIANMPVPLPVGEWDIPEHIRTAFETRSKEQLSSSSQKDDEPDEYDTDDDSPLY